MIEIFPHVYQFKTPIPNSPLGYISAYLLRSAQGDLLIDTGWNTEAAFESLKQQVEEAGAALGNLRTLVITHTHPDHFGLAGRLKALGALELILHEQEARMLDRRNGDLSAILAAMDQWLRINGMPEDERNPPGGAPLPMDSFVTPVMPDRVVFGGEHLQFGEFDLELVWTPGHSPGHLCLYDHSHRLLFSGDHVLPRTTPNISMFTQTFSNPLGDYLDALDRVARLDVDLVLPSHGKPFHGLKARTDAIRQHHEERLEAMLAAFDGHRQTAYTIAGAALWGRTGKSWHELDILQRRFAVTETIAHLELLFARGMLEKSTQDGLAWYAPARG
jgi:glyoxylase-like metal-dependent hydrolase (beta-lactamase superfamily II)